MKLRSVHAAIVLVLILAVAALLIYNLRAPEFIEHNFDGFSIALPGHTPATRTENEKDGTISSASAEAKGFKYGVVYWELPMYLRGVPDKQILESMSLGAGAWKVSTEQKATLAGMPAIEIAGETANGKQMLTRMLRTKDRVYLLTIAGTKAIPANSASKLFFDSFRLLSGAAPDEKPGTN